MKRLAGARRASVPRSPTADASMRLRWIDPFCHRAMRLLARTEGYASVRHLFEGVADLFTQHCGCVVATDCRICSQRLRHDLPGSEIGCRRFCIWRFVVGRRSCPVRCPRDSCSVFADVPFWSVKSLRLGLVTMPTHLSPALLVNANKAGDRACQRLLWTSSCHPGLYVPGNGGGWVPPYGAGRQSSALTQW